MEAIGKVDIGKKRSSNDDSIFVCNTPIGKLPNLYIVADGMGGHRAGGVASKLAIESFYDYIVNHSDANLKTREDITRILKLGIMHANHVIYNESINNEECKGMGTTFTAATVINDVLYLAHVGDTRLYLLNQSGIFQATTDHSLVQEMVDEGHISKEEAREHPQRNIITRAVGTYEKVKVDTLLYDVKMVEYMIICSDGLTDMLDDETIHSIVYNDYGNIENIVDNLIQEANIKGGLDNTAVILGKKYEVSQ